MKSLIISLLLTGLCQCVNAQSFYLKFGGGYSFPLASSVLGKNEVDIYQRETNPETGFYEPSYQVTEEEVTGSYNSGVVSAAAFGCIFSSNMGVELNIGYVFGQRYKAVSESKEIVDGEVTHAGKSTTSWHAANTFVSPAFILTGGEGMFKPYLTAGPVFAFATIDEEYRNHSEFDVNPVPTVRDEKYSGGLSFGLRGTAGVDIQLSEALRLFSEIAFVGMSYHPQERETVRYEVDGEDILSTLNVRGRKVKFVKRTEVDTRASSSSPDQPMEALRVNFGMSSLSAMAGVKIML